MDDIFLKLQRAYYSNASLQNAKAYITMLERINGLNPLPKKIISISKIDNLLIKNDKRAEINKEYIKRQQIIEQVEEYEEKLLERIHNVLDDGEYYKDELYIESPIRYKFLSKEKPFKYKIVRKRNHGSAKKTDEFRIDYLTKVGATTIELSKSRYAYSKKEDDEYIHFENCPHLKYFAISSIPGNSEVLIRINLQEDIEFILELLKGLFS